MFINHLFLFFIVLFVSNKFYILFMLKTLFVRASLHFYVFGLYFSVYLLEVILFLLSYGHYTAMFLFVFFIFLVYLVFFKFILIKFFDRPCEDALFDSHQVYYFWMVLPIISPCADLQFFYMARFEHPILGGNYTDVLVRLPNVVDILNYEGDKASVVLNYPATNLRKILDIKVDLIGPHFCQVEAKVQLFPNTLDPLTPRNQVPRSTSKHFLEISIYPLIPDSVKVTECIQGIDDDYAELIEDKIILSNGSVLTVPFLPNSV